MCIKKLYSEYLKLIKYRYLMVMSPYLTGSPSSDLLQQNCYKVNNTKLKKLSCHLKSLNNFVKSRWQLTCEQLINIFTCCNLFTGVRGAASWNMRY